MSFLRMLLDALEFVESSNFFDDEEARIQKAKGCRKKPDQFIREHESQLASKTAPSRTLTRINSR